MRTTRNDFYGIIRAMGIFIIGLQAMQLALLGSAGLYAWSLLPHNAQSDYLMAFSLLTMLCGAILLAGTLVTMVFALPLMEHIVKRHKASKKQAAADPAPSIDGSTAGLAKPPTK